MEATVFHSLIFSTVLSLLPVFKGKELTNQKARIIGGHLKGLTQVINNDFKVTSIKTGVFRA